MPTTNLLYNHELPINEKISIMIPKVGEIIDFGENEYYSQINTLTAMPIDMMVLLDDIGIDFSKIDEFDLFIIMSQTLKGVDTSLVFKDLCFKNFTTAINKENDTLFLYDEKNDIVIDKAIHNDIAEKLRKIHHLEKNIRKPGNDAAKEYMITKERKRLRRLKNKTTDSHLEELIVAMVNTSEFKYNYESVLDLTIYQFNESVRQIVNKVNYDNRMHGVYAGTIDAKELSQDDFNWLTSKKNKI